MITIKCEWMLCPVCGNKTRNKIREDTVLKNYPLYCPKCKHESLVEVKDLQIIVIKEPDALDAEPMNL
ncbi:MULTISPECIES: cysteine-rich KTR domain-containing protein [unclassified Clostridium]|uniref:cysteine-rich KTR domain-containing protein n=1 Tax=unclassified Clostridium TaxID=2614128 RepID=UPI0011075917|nr:MULTISPECIES: cysteine-rich KTR domain-containing protein [unclassified Clostridium]MBY1896627.1 cysteine-rich KTR domain-containing protein [Clostridioides difficile]